MIIPILITIPISIPLPISLPIPIPISVSVSISSTTVIGIPVRVWLEWRMKASGTHMIDTIVAVGVQQLVIVVTAPIRIIPIRITMVIAVVVVTLHVKV